MSQDTRIEEGLSRRQLLRGGLLVGGAALVAGGCSESEAAENGDGSKGCEALPVDPDYDGGQRLYRRNDGGDAMGGGVTSAISEGQTYGDMIIKSSAMYQMRGAVSHMETTVGPKTIIAPHRHENADQLVIILGVIDEMTAHGDDELQATTVYECDPRYLPNGDEPVSLRFQFDPQDPAKASEIIECPVGSYVLKPRGITHAFWNPTNKRIAYVEISTGVDFEVFVRGSANINSIEELEALEEEGNTYFEDVPVLARLMFEHKIPNVKGMGGLNDAVQDIRTKLADAIRTLADAAGLPVPPDLRAITLDR